MTQANLFEQDINSEIKIHSRENNAESEAILIENDKKLINQCNVVFDYLMAGNSLTVVKALRFWCNGKMNTIGDLRRRIKDLKDHNKVSISFIKLNGGAKEWYMSDDDIKANMDLSITAKQKTFK